jgi:hypothetical protein
VAGGEGGRGGGVGEKTVYSGTSGEVLCFRHASSSHGLQHSHHPAVLESNGYGVKE